MSRFRFDPNTYMELMDEEVPHYDALQDGVATQAASVEATRILDLGTGTGETLGRVLTHHASAEAIGIDENDDMLAAASDRLAGFRADLRVADLLDPLPDGPFDLVVSALAIHHLDGPGKAELFRRVAECLRPGGRFVLGDVVVPDGTPIDPHSEEHDKPSSVADQLEWLTDAGFTAAVVWRHDDLALLVADRRS